MPSSPVVIALLAAGLGVSALIDLKTRRIPNALTMAIAATGVTCAAWGASGVSVGASLAGLALGLVLMLPGHLLGGTGAGDVKLFAAIGTLIGPASVVTAFLYTAIAGGLLAIVIALHRQRLTRTIANVAHLATTTAAPAEVTHARTNNRFAYAPAIAVGTLLAALGL